MLDNKNLYNDKELCEDADLDWYDYGFRSYDPQIGRFPQLDPLTDDYPHYTPYQYAGNEPIANVDLDGLEPFNAVQTLETVTIKVSVKAAPKVAIKTFEAALKIGGKALQLGLKSASDKTLINTTLRNPNVPLSKPKRGGWRPTSKYGEGEEGAVHSDDADGQPFSIDGLFDLFSWGSKVKPHPLKPNFSDPLTIPKMENKILKKFGGENTTGKPYSKTTKVCPDCMSGDREPEYNAKAYLLDENGKVIDTLTRNTKTGKVDTSSRKNK